jgi:hypothetical protein
MSSLRVERVDAGAQAVLTLDKAGWHTTRKLQLRPTSAFCACRRPAQS